ncbi:MAG: YqiJ family protein [Gammaproteobacteria bacterium]|nr:YqiJ family protein [Gammaproteobacteria bacterium]
MSVFLFTQAYFIYSVPILVGLMLCTIESLFLLRGKSFFGLLDMPPHYSQGVLTPYHCVPRTLRLYEVTIVFWFMVFFITFGISGMLIQRLYFAYWQAYAPQTLLLPVTLGIAATATAVVIHHLAPHLRSYNSLRASEEYAGRIATIEGYSEFLGDKVRASVFDHNHQLQNITVQAMEANERLLSGDKVVLVKRTNDSWLATRHIGREQHGPKTRAKTIR